MLYHIFNGISDMKKVFISLVPGQSMMKGPVIIIIVRKVVLLKVGKVIIVLGKFWIEISSDDARIYGT